jgi:hypothetical protein
MKYSESYNSDLHLGFLSWIVPSFDGKSGVYLLSVNDLKTFIFHHPEYTDIFVNYIDNIRS